MAISKGNFAKALWPGVNKWYGESYNEHPLECLQLFDKESSSKAFEEDIGTTGLGQAAAIGEGSPVTYDSMRQGFLTRYTHVKYGLGFIITDEMIEDDQYGVIAKKSSRAIGFSMRQTKETVGANVYNRAFNPTYAGGDSVELCSAVHPNVTGGTWANELSQAADLSEASLEQATIDIGTWTDDRGNKIAIMPEKLVIPIQLQYKAERILMSPLRVGTAENDINALK